MPNNSLEGLNQAPPFSIQDEFSLIKQERLSKSTKKDEEYDLKQFITFNHSQSKKLNRIQ